MLFFILGYFLLFYQGEKWKCQKKIKKHLEISSFYTSVPKLMIICYAVPEIWYVTDVIVVFHFGLFFAVLPPPPFPPPNSPRNINFKKMKKHLKILSFYTSVQKIMIISYTVPEIWHLMDAIVVFHFGQLFAPLPR